MLGRCCWLHLPAKLCTTFDPSEGIPLMFRFQVVEWFDGSDCFQDHLSQDSLLRQFGEGNLSRKPSKYSEKSPGNLNCPHACR